MAYCSVTLTYTVFMLKNSTSTCDVAAFKHTQTLCQTVITLTGLYKPYDMENIVLSCNTH